MTRSLQRLATVMVLMVSLWSGLRALAQRKPDASDPSGIWQTTDDKTGQPKGEVRIFLRDGRLFGQITRVYDPKDAASLCDECRDERKGQKIEGLMILRDMRLVDGEYQGGDILDPDTGRVYKCKMRLADGGRHMLVRGFLGFSLLGRSQTWTRLDKPA